MIELLVKIATNINVPVTSLLHNRTFEMISTKIADMPMTNHATTVGINTSKEKTSLGTCSKMIAGREIYIINWFNIVGVSLENMFNF